MPFAPIFNNTSSLLGHAGIGEALSLQLQGQFTTEILTAFGATDNDALRKAVTGLDLKLAELKDRTMTDVISKKVLPALEGKDEFKALIDQNITDNRKVNNVLHLNKSLTENPFTLEIVNEEKAKSLGSLAGLGKDFNTNQLGVLFGQGISNRNAVLDSLERDEKISAGEKSNLLEKLNLADITRDRFGLIEKMQSNDIEKSLDLVQVSNSKMKDFIERDDIPDGMNEAQFASEILGKVEQMHRSAHFMYRLVDNPRLVANNIRYDLPVNLKDSMTALYKSNPSLDLMTANLLPVFGTETKLEGMDGIDENQRPGVLKQLIILQQTLKITPDTNTANILLKNNWTGSRIANISSERFAHETGLTRYEAQNVHRNAVRANTKAAHAFRGMYEMMNDPFLKTRASNFDYNEKLYKGILEKIARISDENDLKPIETMESLFGSQDYCECDDCQSVLSPAAYFVDLMRFVEHHIWKTTLVNSMLEIDDPLHLKTRRPDLWILELTCENTNDHIQYIDIVIEVMTEFIKANYKKNNPEEEDIDAENALAEEPAGLEFSLPYNASLDEVRTYLKYFDLDRYHLLRQLYPHPDPQQRLTLALEKLNLTREAYIIIIDTNNSGRDDSFEQNVLKFRKQTGLSSSETDALVKMGFWNGELKIDSIPKADDIQGFDLQFTTTTAGFPFAKHLHRLLRLLNATGYSISDLDYILDALEVSYKNLDETAIRSLADAKELQEILDVSAEVLAGIIYLIPDPGKLPATEQKKSLWYQRGIDKIEDKELKKLVENDPEEENNAILLQRLLGFLNISSTDWGILSTKLHMEEFKLTPINLSLLFRNVQFIKWSKADVTDFLNALDAANKKIDTLENMLDTARFILDLKAVNLTLKELNYLVGEVDIDKVEASKEETKRLDELIKKFKDEKPQEFGADALTDLTFEGKLKTNVNSQDKQDWVDKEIIPFLRNTFFQWDANKTPLVILSEGKYRLGAAFGLPPDVKIDGFHKDTDEILAKLLNYHPYLLLFSEWLNTDKTLIKHLHKYLHDWDENRTTEYVNSLIEKDDTEQRKKLIQIKRVLERMIFLYKKYNIDPDTAKDIWQSFNNGKNILAYVHGERLTLQNIQALQSVGKLAAELKILTPEKPYQVVPMLERYPQKEAETLNQDDYTLLRKWQKSDEKLLREMVVTLGKPAIPALGFSRMLTLVAYCKKLAISTERLFDFGKDDLETLKKVADTIKEAFRAKFEDEKAWKEKAGDYQNPVNDRKRNALCNYLIYHRGPKNSAYGFNNRSQLYQYFLLDVEMGDCYTTSRVVAATGSIQLYVHRCIMGLEQSESRPGFMVLMDEEGLKQWDWRKNYRVWEANRRVFLFPENYIEPELRDNKTPQFKELEDELLQQKLNLEVVEAAYRKYFIQFMEFTQLRIAGSYYDTISESIYIFWRTNTEPYQYYYHFVRLLAGDQTDWSNLKKIELQISSKEISAIYQRNRLFIFWTTTQRTDIREMKNGNNELKEYQYDIYANYSSLNENEKWNVPQKIKLDYFKANKDTPWNRTEKDKNITPESHALNLFDKLLFLPFFLSTEESRSDLISLYSINTSKINDNYIDYKDFDAYIVPEQVFKFNKIKSESTITYQAVAVPLTVKKEEELFYEYQKTFTIPSFKVTNIGFGGQIFKQYRNIGDLSVEFIFEVVVILGQYNTNLKILATPILANNPIITEITGDVTAEFGDIKIYSEVNKLIAQGRCTSLGKLTKYNPSGSVYNLNLITNEIEEPSHNFEDIETASLPNLLDSYLKIANVPGKYYIKRNGLSLSDSVSIEKFSDSGYILIKDLVQCPLTPVPGAIKTLFNSMGKGLEYFLSISNQKMDNNIIPYLSQKQCFNNYFQEMFFHIPYLIANHLNASGKYKEAHFWYSFIFDPTLSNIDSDPDFGKPGINTNWQFADFRDNPVEKMMEIYSNPSTIDIYNNFPFNPHKIARQRISAYPKNILMKYLDNLLDWADNLFTQYLPEPVNEALMLYTMVADILGNKPQSTGKCKTHGKSTYEKLLSPLEDPSLGNSEFLLYAIANQQPEHPEVIGSTIPLDLGFMLAESVPIYKVEKELVFCIPNNEQFLKYWDRVENRLFNIRHCLDINGMKRTMPLFAPPIDPAMLVRARAAGLSLEDILAQLNSQMVPYRFSYLVEKARQYCGTVQSFGSALLSALEKKDAEELTLLRSAHEQHILKLSESIKKQQIEESKDSLENLKETKTNIEIRIDHYKGLINNGLIETEISQQSLQMEAGKSETYASKLKILASVLRLIPQAGAPTAMTYGGFELGHSSEMYGSATSSLSSISKIVADMTGINASHIRREEDWKFNLKLAEQELKAFDKQLAVAEIRVAIAEKDLESHQQNMEQAKALQDFYKEKFSNVRMYTYHATSLQRLYREAYNMAYDMARTVERAFQFERDEDAAFFIQNNNLHDDFAGLLAGEKLLLQLQQMEKKWIETNKRTPEITQSFSMQQIAPDKLLELKINGECSGFAIPEEAFDLVYPGYYKRVIKSVRITMPCIVGPYTNVGVTLTLDGSTIKNKDNTTREGYKDTINLATSSAQNDGGQFELNFRDERYLPFEGAGAVGTWTLKMPNIFRPFDYNTISDVIFHISYTAAYGRDVKIVEEELSNKFGADTLYRLFSLRHDFPLQYNQLKNGPDPVNIELKSEMFPFFVQGRFGGIENVFKEYKLIENGLAEGHPYKPDEGKLIEVTVNKVTKKDEQFVTISKYEHMEAIKDIIWIVNYNVT